MKKENETKISSLGEIKKILFIEIWGIGDLVMMIPVLSSTRENFPSAKIALLSKAHALDLLKSDNLVDDYIIYNFPWTKHKGKYRFWAWDWLALIRLIKRLRNERFDLILDARGDFRNNLLSFFIGAKKRVGYEWTGGGYFLTDVVPFDYEYAHRVDAWLNLLRYFDIQVNNFKPHISVPKDEEAWSDDFLRNKGIEKGDLLIGIHPGAGVKTRCWPLNRFKELASYLNNEYKAKILIFIEPDGYGEEIADEKHSIRAKLSLRELICLISKVDLFICNDGGPMHIATAVHVPVVAIFGPGNLNIISPYGDQNRVVIKENVPCRPCRDYCLHKEPYCLTEISVKEVARVIDEMLNSNKILAKR